MSDTSESSEIQPTLRGVIAKALGDAWDAEDVVWHDNDGADAILNTPEMQAIRRSLHDAYHPVKWLTALGPGPLHRKNLAAAGLPPAVVEWVATMPEEDRL